MVLTIMVPHFPVIGSGGMPPVHPTILMSARMNKSCCFVLQYNTEALVLVLQYYFGK
jgi:hypothetical protein